MENANFNQFFLRTMISHLQTYKKWGRLAQVRISNVRLDKTMPG
jgi:hypothetical protein